jgi:hypothetical protein
MYCTLPSGKTATVDEMMEIAPQWHEASQPREPHTPAPIENERWKYVTTLPRGA